MCVLRVYVKFREMGIDVSAPSIGQRLSYAISGTAWLLFCRVPRVTFGIRPSGLLRGAICFRVPKTPPGFNVPFAGQDFGGAQSPSAALRSKAFWMLASASGSSGGPTSVL